MPLFSKFRMPMGFGGFYKDISELWIVTITESWILKGHKILKNAGNLLYTFIIRIM